MRKSPFLLLVLVCLAFIEARAQRASLKDLQGDIRYSIEKAYSASVRIWAFDTVRNARTGPQFTGVVVTPGGHILTAAHVNTPGTTYKVMFPDGQSTIAVGQGEIELEASPFMPDVAMLKIVHNGAWPSAPMGHSARLAKGMLTVSIAYPESLDQALPMVRVGEIYDVHNQYGFLQSTCLMEPGDSGGPLFDARGNVIGIHSAIDVSEKENFEVPVDLYRTYWSALQQPRTYGEYPLLKDSLEANPASAQLKTYPDLDDLDNSLKMNSAIMKTAVTISSTLSEKPQQIVGALIHAGGKKKSSKLRGHSLVVSKSSAVGTDPLVRVAGRLLKAKVLARDKENDLVLLAVESKLKGGINLAAADTTVISLQELGRFLISPLNGKQHRVSVLGTQFFSLPKMESVGYLGAQVAYFGPLLITEVPPQASSGESPFEKGDELLAINGIKLGNRADFLRESKKYWPGDTINVGLKRSEENLTKTLVLGYRPETVGTHPAERFDGGKSRRRDGFAAVFAHDARLKPSECGGAVFDLTGRFYGINIGRFSRVSNLVVPAGMVRRFIETAISD